MSVLNLGFPSHQFHPFLLQVKWLHGYKFHSNL
nr:MAG TPA: hypothetical protein [Caudoviricetes sp.]